jgi:hypothetical protein
MSVEVLPSITSGLLCLYSVFRFVVTFFKKGKQSILKYWSRFLFRLTFLVSSSIQFTSTLPIESAISVKKLSVFAGGFLAVALMFLVLSIQDFVCYSNRLPTFIKRNWLFLTAPFVVTLIEAQYAWYQANYVFFDVKLVARIEIICEVVQSVFIILEIIIPSFFFIYEIKKTDFSGSMRGKIIAAAIFFTIDFIALVSLAVVQILIIKSAFNLGRDSFVIYKSTRDPVMMFICFTQDMIDWMMNWIYLDEEAIYNEEDESEDREDPVKIELISSDL